MPATDTVSERGLGSCGASLPTYFSSSKAEVSIDRGLSRNVPGALPFLSLSFSFSTSSSPGKVVAVTCEVGGAGEQLTPRFPPSSIMPYSLAWWGFFFFGTFFLKVAPHSVVRVHPISLPVLIVLAVNTGCLCIFPAHYQQIALIMQIHPSHCALHSAQVIKHN